MAVDVIAVDVRLNIRDMKIRILGAFPSFKNHWWTNQSAAVPIKYPSIFRFRPGCAELSDSSTTTSSAGGRIPGHRIEHPEKRIRGAKHIARKIDAMPKANFDAALDTGHPINV